jgi:hypothetical protein
MNQSFFIVVVIIFIFVVVALLSLNVAGSKNGSAIHFSDEIV